MAKKEKEPEVILKPNEMFLPTGEYDEDNNAILKPKRIPSTKLQYMIGSKEFYGYRIIEQFSIIDIMAASDGEELIRNYLMAVFNDKDFTSIIFEDLDQEMLLEIVRISKIVNDIQKEEENPKNVETEKEEVESQ